jgi:hypothetical protein
MRYDPNEYNSFRGDINIPYIDVVPETKQTLIAVAWSCAVGIMVGLAIYFFLTPCEALCAIS